ncbi:hypothetical protein NFHSH190041_17650 [Shewanella sp. NFH-SH190041]|uniref:DUF1302 domain-containing protein n=1 Tax=Shewanella sp. NFH-SH190041 TaxID=2950245 RepID=UPI0021C30771|nr:DUF1302 domain-containing protein [Shewanella sp. NFH-SH190041]BDM64313.1 hypothetical protein NFHSH190041_17650 [Shewanella sp. NFH-SH190041]
MKKFKNSLLSAAVLTALASGQAFAGETIELGDDVTLDWKGTLTYSAGIRLEDPDPVLSKGSSGDRNFDKHDLIGNGIYLLLEGHLRWGGSGLVFSGSTFYDDVYKDGKFSDAVQKYHGGYTRLLDLYAYTTFAFGEMGYADIRAGRHVVAWGEGLFFPSMSLAQGPSDGIKSSVPGTEVKDILLPEDQVSVQVELNADWSVMAHWQFNWQETIVPEPGSFFSTSEAVGNGAFCLVPLPTGGCGYGPRAADVEPDSSGQWGVGARYRVTDVTELGLYYLNYADRIPMVDIDPTKNYIPAINFALGEYRVVYFDDIDLIVATLSTNTGMASVAAEITYKDGAPVLVSSMVGPLATPGEILQSNLNAVVNFGRTSFAESVNLTAEVAYVDIMDVEARSPTGLPQLPASDDLYYTGHGLALGASLILSYPGLTENWDMSIPVGYSHQISGRTITGGAGGEGDIRARVGADFTHHRTGIQLGIQYVRYMGDPDVTEPYKERSLSDRDNLAFTAKYAF